MGKVVFLKLKNSSLQDYSKICIEDVRSMIPVVDKKGKAHLLINFYDWEYCLNNSTFCDEIEDVIIEEYEDESK